MRESLNKPSYSYFGPVLDRPFCAILNSRQNKNPRGADGWVKATINAVRAQIGQGNTILSSLGMHTWGLLTWACGHYGGNLIIVHPLYRGENPEKTISNITADFALDQNRTGFLFFDTDAPITRPKLAWQERDAIIVNSADILCPVSARPGGNMSLLIKASGSSGKTINNDFRIEYEKPKSRKIPPLNADAIAARFPAETWDYLTHWTHTFDGPWPGETSADYYYAVANSGENYPRSAFDSLVRILSERKIRCSECKSKSGDSYVSFTDVPPSEAVKLMRWHARKMRYTFEPFGVSLKRDIGREIGIKPVTYGNAKTYESLSAKERPYFHPKGKKGDWEPEREWRFIGDFNLGKLSRDSYIVIVRGRADIAKLSDFTDIEIISLES